MKIMIAGAWDETNENLLSSAFQIAKVAAEKKHIIITGGGTGIPNSQALVLKLLKRKING